MTDNLVLPIDLFAFNTRMSFSYLGFFLFLFVFIFSVYKIFKNELDPSSRFDLGFKTLFGSLLVARILAVLNNLGHYSSNWSEVFNVFDGKFLYSGLVLGIIILVIFFNSKLNKRLGYLFILDRLLISYIIAVIWLILGMVLDGHILGVVNYGSFSFTYSDGLTRFPVGLLQIAYNVFAFILFIFLVRLKEKRGLISSIYLVLFASIEFVLRYFSANYEPIFFNLLDLYQIISLIIIVMSIFMIMSINKSGKIENNLENDRIDTNTDRAQFDINEFKRRKISAKEMFSMSYSSIGKDSKEFLPTKERVSRWYKKIKK